MRFFCLLLSAALLLCHAVPAGAQNAIMAGYTETEKVGFAFYRMINRDPPFEDWIVNRPDYQAAMPQIRMDIMDQQRDRLRQGYANFFPERDMIAIEVPLIYSASKNPDYDKDPAAEAKGLVQRVQIRFPEVKGQPYFPFQIGKLWVGLIPQDIESIFRQDMTAAEFKHFCGAISDCTNFQNRKIPTMIVMRPVKADAKTPMMDGDLPIWLMLSDVGSIYINDNKTTAWSYTAPWYSTRQTQELMTLYDK